MTLEENILTVLKKAHDEIEPPATWDPLSTHDIQIRVNELSGGECTYLEVLRELIYLMDTKEIKGRLRGNGLMAWSWE